MIPDVRSEIWLVRHGQSESNANLATVSPHSTRLTETGWRQASRFARLIDVQPDLIIVSPYVRSVQSARPLCERYPQTPVEEWPVQEFTYLSPAAYQGTTAAQRRPQIDAYWRKSDPKFHHPGAESFSVFLSRVTEVIERLKQLKGFVMIISHGHTIRLLWQLLSSGVALSPEKQMQAYYHLRQSVVISNFAVLKLRFVSETDVWMTGFSDGLGMKKYPE
ncbi:MAG: histidine phosphatase family protein [Desulfobulbaceae bacterium]|nr:histidine phosphatase family protein [Desulfobulbaceae bacterium]